MIPEQLYGHYRGFAPTDESPIAMGELEIFVTKQALTIRHATGLGIEKTVIPTSNFTEMSRNDVATLYEPNNPVVERIVGFSMGQNMKYLFIPDAGDDEWGLIIVGYKRPDGPTVLYNPRQVEEGVYQRIVSGIEEECEIGCFPTLAADGKLPK